MAARLIELITGSIEDKRHWRRYRARAQQLPGGYRVAVDALERYFLATGSPSTGEVLLRMVDDLADLLERAAADGTPIRDLVGDDPVDFADTFLANYATERWTSAKERERLTGAIDRAAAEQA